MAVVAFAAAPPAPGAARLDVYRLNDALGAAGWHLNALQRPPALHMCFTAAHTSAQPLLRARARRTSARPGVAYRKSARSSVASPVLGRELRTVYLRARPAPFIRACAQAWPRPAPARWAGHLHSMRVCATL